MIYTDIQNRYNRARLDRETDVVAALSTLLGDAQTKAKNSKVEILGDAEMTALVKSYINNLNVTLEAVKNTIVGPSLQVTVDDINAEIALLESFMPKQLTEGELYGIVDGYSIKYAVDNGVKPDMGKVMTFLKTNYAGQYDGKLASSVVRNALA